MKDKKHKYYEGLIEDYLLLSNENDELPRLIEKVKDKLDVLLTDKSGSVLKSGEADTAYKMFLQIRKYEYRKGELESELHEVEDILKQFLKSINGCKLSYKERDDEDKTKTTYSFWLEDDLVKSNRQLKDL